MSSLRTPAPIDTAWLRDPNVGRYLEVRARAAEAESDRLSFFAPDFALNDPEPWLIGTETDRTATFPPAELPRLTHRAGPSPAEFDLTFEDITKRVARGEFQKVVPVVFEHLRFAADLNPGMFPRATGAPPPPKQWSYGFSLGSEGLAGLTPELLFDISGGRLTTMALAGTGPALGPDLRDDPKEMHEHRLVIEHLTVELRRWGEPDVGQTIERTFGAIKHLYTPITVALNKLPSFMEVVVALHPTAALGGYPRRPAIEWLERQAFHVARRRFGAPFGYRDGETSRCAVAIRGVQWKHQDLLIAAGCGVVEQSVVAAEWRELELKRRAIYANLGLEL